MTDQQQHETGFWSGLVQKYGPDYRDFRISEYPDKTKRFEPYWSAQQGLGLEVGCGCLSVLEGCGKRYIAIDPLMPEYLAMPAWPKGLTANDSPICYEQADAELLRFGDGHFNWVFCVNMLDHTPDPNKAVAEMYRVLTPGGHLFFEVHFDDTLSPAHYGLWRLDTVFRTVDSVFGAPLQREVIRVDEDNQFQHWGVYEKR